MMTEPQRSETAGTRPEFGELRARLGCTSATHEFFRLMEETRRSEGALRVEIEAVKQKLEQKFDGLSKELATRLTVAIATA